MTGKHWSEDFKLKGYFVTLTYSDETLDYFAKVGVDENRLTGYDMDNEISRVSVRRFCERWRKKFGKSVRHWFVNELGGNFSERVHLHGLVWTGENPEEIGKVWNFSPSNGRYKGRKLGGNLYIGIVTGKLIRVNVPFR